MHEGGDVGDQLHGSGQGVRASGAGGLHSLLQGLHYHLHRATHTPLIGGTHEELLSRMQVSARQLSLLQGVGHWGLMMTSAFGRCRFSMMTCASGIAT